MPSSYTPPDVIVEQVRRTNLGTLRPPQLPVVVVAPAVQIASRVLCGTYDATVEATVPFKTLTAGGIIDPATVSVLLDATSDSGKPLGLFTLNSNEYTIINDAENNPSQLLITGAITLELSILSARNNTLDSTNNDYGSGTPEGMVFSDSAIDFLAKGATPDGDSFVVINSPVSMAGAYRILELIANGNVVRSVLLEKVTAADYGQPELVKSVVINGAQTPTGSTLRGFDAATHEAALISGHSSNLTSASTGLGVGVINAVDLDGAGTVKFDAAAIDALLTSGSGSPRLYIPGIASNLEVTFAPVDALGDPINRTNTLWAAAMSRVKIGDWLRVRYAALSGSGTGTISSIVYTGPTAGTVTFSTGGFVDAGWTGRTLVIAGNGPASSLNNIAYEIISVDTGTNSVVVDLSPFGGVFPGGSQVTPGTATVSAQALIDRDFKVLSVDAVNKAVSISALGNASVANDIIMLPTTGLVEFSFLNVIKGKSDTVNGAGDFVTFSVDSAPYRYEANVVTPSSIVVVGTLPSFAATIVVLGTIPTGTVDSGAGATDFSAGVIKFSTAGYVQSVFAGMTARLSNNTNSPSRDGDYTVTAISVLNNTITVSPAPGVSTEEDGEVQVIQFLDTPVVYRRGIPYRNSAASYDLIKQLSDRWTADIEVSFHALRMDLPLNGLMELSSRADIETVIGVITPDNPLAMGCDMIVRSGLADGVRTFYALATTGDSVGAHTDAMEVLETSDVYFIVPMTQDEAVISAYKAHVDVQSEAPNKHERVVIVNTKLVTYESILPLAGTAIPTGTIDTANTIVAVVDWGIVNQGDVIKVLVNPGADDEAVETSNRVVSIDLGTNTVTVLAPWPAALVGQTRSFRVDTYPLTKSEQAENWRDYAASMQDSRVMVIRPDNVELSYTDKTVVPSVGRTVTVGGQYACAAFAGLAAALEPSAPMTNVGVPGLVRLIHSNDYFRPDQLNVIAEGGNNILVQETRNSIPYSRHQLTTDMRSLVSREFSIIKLVDYSAKFVRNSLRPYIGNRNITTQYLAQLRGTCEAIIRALVRGEVLLSKTELLSLKQDVDSPDQIIIEIALDVPYPANRIYVTLYI